MAFKIGTEQGDGCSPSLYYKSARPAHVNPNDEEDVARWAKNLEVSRGELLDAIKVYGTDVRNLRKGLLSEKAA